MLPVWMRSVIAIFLRPIRTNWSLLFVSPQMTSVLWILNYLSQVSPALCKQIFSVRASGKPNYLGARIPVPTHWELDLLENLLDYYEDKLAAEFLRYGWPMSRSIFLHTCGSAKVNHKSAIKFSEAINQYLATEHSKNTLLGL